MAIDSHQLLPDSGICLDVAMGSDPGAMSKAGEKDPLETEMGISGSASGGCGSRLYFQGRESFSGTHISSPFFPRI